MDTESKKSERSIEETIDIVARNAVALYVELLVPRESYGWSPSPWIDLATHAELLRGVRNLLESHHQSTITHPPKIKTGVSNDQADGFYGHDYRDVIWLCKLENE